MERNPKLRQTSMSTSASFSVSAQCWILPVLKHSPEIPALAVNSEPSGGAASPLRARQTIAPSFHIARATPEAPVSRPALSAMVLNIESRGRSPTSIRSFRGASAALSSVPGPMPGGRMERLFEASSEELRSNTESSVEKRNGLDSGTPTNLPQLAIIPRNASCAPLWRSMSQTSLGCQAKQGREGGEKTTSRIIGRSRIAQPFSSQNFAHPQNVSLICSVDPRKALLKLHQTN
jgi:hypothetical protein